MDAQLKAVVSRLENLASRFEAVCPKGGASSALSAQSSESDSPIVRAYDDSVNGPVSQFLSLSAKIGEDVAQMGNIVKNAFDIHRQFIVMTSQYAKPSADAINKLLAPTSQAIQDVQSFREKNRPSKNFNHLSAVSESILALGWISVSPTPGPYVKESLDAGQFYTNRVLKDYKGKDQTHVDWVASWIQALTALHGYVRQHHTTGIVWNPKGQPAPASAPNPPARAGGPPPPPPPGPPPPLPPMDSSAPPANDGRAQLFASINKGDNITSSLKKVTADQQTHKNPSLRANTAVPDNSQSAASAGGPAKAAPVKRPPITKLVGKKWIVENHTDNRELVIAGTEMNQSVYIYNCNKCAVQVKGKINSIVVDSCKKTSLLFENIVACVEFINCQSIQSQVTGVVPTISVDKTDGFQIYLSAASMGTEIISSKSSEMNVSYPKQNGDFVEVPLPEQYKTIWNGKSFVTLPTEQAA